MKLSKVILILTNVEHRVTGSTVRDATGGYQNYFKVEKAKVINGVVQKDVNGRVIPDGPPICVGQALHRHLTIKLSPNRAVGIKEVCCSNNNFR
jgi:hypothetical protein